MDLPPELIEMILDHLIDDPWTLRVCSLVSRSWRHPSHRRLFRRIDLFPAHPWFRLLLQSVRLYKFLLEAPYIADCIQELKVCEGKRCKGEHWIGTDQTLPLLFLMLKNLKRIEFVRLYWNELSLDLRQSIHSVLNLRSLTSLEIVDSDFASMDDFINLLSYAENITVLSLKNIRTSSSFSEHLIQKETGTKEPPFNSYKQKHLLELNWALDDIRRFCDWLLGPQSLWKVSHVHTLKMLHVDQVDIDAINRLLRAIGSGLRHFEFDMPWISIVAAENPTARINFEFNSNLIYFTCTIQVRTHKIRDQLQPLVDFFSSFGESNRLEEIELIMPDYSDYRPLDWSSWQGVDHLLAGPKFRCLQKVDIDTRSFQRGESRETTRNLVRWSPLLGERGILVIH